MRGFISFFSILILLLTFSNVSWALDAAHCVPACPVGMVCIGEICGFSNQGSTFDALRKAATRGSGDDTGTASGVTVTSDDIVPDAGTEMESNPVIALSSTTFEKICGGTDWVLDFDNVLRCGDPEDCGENCPIKFGIVKGNSDYWSCVSGNGEINCIQAPLTDLQTQPTTIQWGSLPETTTVNPDQDGIIMNKTLPSVFRVMRIDGGSGLGARCNSGLRCGKADNPDHASCGGTGCGCGPDKTCE